MVSKIASKKRLGEAGAVWGQASRAGEGYARLEEVKLVFYGRSLIWSWSLACWMVESSRVASSGLGSVPFGQLQVAT